LRFANSITVQRSPHDVFEYLANFENVPEWNYAIVQTRKTSDGSVGVGTKYRQTRSLPSPSEEAFEVTEFEPDQRLAVHGGLGPFEGTLTYELEAVANGTKITNFADLQAHGLLKIAAPFASSRVGDAVAANLQQLKEILER